MAAGLGRAVLRLRNLQHGAPYVTVASVQQQPMWFVGSSASTEQAMSMRTATLDQVSVVHVPSADELISMLLSIMLS